jgi:hypothetical protein
VKTVSGGGYGGALTAGLFLQEFVDGAPWVHLDIAGPARAGSDDGYVVKGGTGFGVRTLVELDDTFTKKRAIRAQLRHDAALWRRIVSQLLDCGWPQARETRSSRSSDQ